MSVYKNIIIWFFLFWLALCLDLYFFISNIHFSFLMIYGIFFLFNFNLQKALLLSFISGLILDALNFFSSFGQCLIMPLAILVLYFLNRLLNNDNLSSKLLIGTVTLLFFELLKGLSYILFGLHFFWIYLFYNYLASAIVFAILIYITDKFKKYALRH